MSTSKNFINYSQNVIIHESAIIGENVSINPFVTIGPNVEVGDESKISSHVVIGSPAEMPGEKIKNFTVKIGSNVTIREFTTIHSGHTRDTQIEDNVYIMNHSHIAHDCFIRKNSTISAGVTLAGSVEIGEECFIGIESSLHQESIVGNLTILGANSFGKGILGPCLKYVGNPAIPISINQFAINKSKKNENEIKELLTEGYKFLNGK